MHDRYRGTIKCMHPHFCYDWDSQFITPLMIEFEACTCKCDGGPINEDLKMWPSLDAIEKIWFKEWLYHEKEKQKKISLETVST